MPFYDATLTLKGNMTMGLRTAVLLAFVFVSLGPFATNRAADSVPLQSGAAALGPQNTKLQFVCAHVGAKPDPRKGGFAKFTGKAQVEGQALKSLNVEIDTTSISTEFEKLTTHLKSPDFFDVRRFPTAKFESTKITPGSGSSQITGKLTLHGVTKEISFPATVEIGASGVSVKSEFSIDRSEFGMMYDPTKVENKVSLTIVVGEKT
jgi:polyisoprenoid-binding protein YceI